MNRVLSVSLILLSVIVLSGANRPYVGDKLIRLEPQNDEQIQYLRDLEENNSLDFWTDVIGANKPIELHVPSNEFDEYASQFNARSIPFRILVDDLQTVIDDEKQKLEEDLSIRRFKSRLFRQPRVDIVGTYASYNDMVTFMQDTAAADSRHISVVDIGRTYENRTIKGIVLSFNPSAHRNIWIDCGIHAREWITPAVCIWMIDTLIDEYRANDAQVTEMLNYWNVYIAPSLNPDGYEYSRSTSRLWRKSRARPPTGTCYGVDLNRNYPLRWNTGGASSSRCSETYAGPSAGSEPETQGVVNFLTAKKNTWDMYMSFHSYGQWWFTPYGYTTSLPANYNKQFALAKKGADAIQRVNNRAYAVGSVANLLYIASGSTVDWAHDALGITYSYTIELPPRSSDSATGFVLPPALAPEVCHETYVGMKEFLVAVNNEVKRK